MKDLIAKLHSDAADQILATFSTLEMQLQGFAKSSYEKDLRIAELEAQTAAASAPVVEQQPIGYTCQYDLDCLANYNNVTIFPEFDKDISPIALYTAPQTADTDKLREAIYQFQHRDSPIIWTDVDAYVYETQVAGGDQSRVRKVFLADEMALQAPVREVPGWQPIETAPKDGTRVLLYGTRYSMLKPASKILAGNFNRGWWADGTDLSHVTHWAPLPAAPVQEQKP